MERQKTRKEENVLFNDALNTFYLRLYGFGISYTSCRTLAEMRNTAIISLFRELLFLISSKGSFICTIPQPG